MKSVKEMITKLYGSRRFNLAVFGLIAVLVLIAYSNTFTSSFHFDDNPAIADNATLKWATLDNISTIVFGARPVVYLSLMLNYQLNGLNVTGYHIFNIGLHIANSFLVYLFILRTLTLPALKARYVERAGWMALFGALLFAVHPIQTETVTYIISRSELLATFFYLGAILLFISGAQTGRWRYYAMAFCSAVLAMGSKEWAVTLPAVILLYDYLFLARGKIKTALSRWGAYISLVLSCWVVLRNLSLFSAENSTVGFNIIQHSSSGEALTARTYLLTSFNVTWTYIRLLFLPIKQNIDYDYPIAQALLGFPTLLSFVGHVAVVGGAFWLFLKKRWALVPFGAAWFYITLSPVQSFVPLTDVIFEHRVYLPSVGFFLAFVILYEQLFARIEQRDVSGGDISRGGSEEVFAAKGPAASQKGKKLSRKAARRAKKDGTSV
jgi:hypothetical protein